MDSAGPDQVKTAVTQQGILLDQHSSQLTATSREGDLLTAQEAKLNARVQELEQEALASRSGASLAHSPPQAEPEPNASSPPPYDGDPNYIVLGLPVPVLLGLRTPTPAVLHPTMEILQSLSHRLFHPV